MMRAMMHRTALAAAALLLLAACSKLTLANYDRVKVGMAYEEVTALLGKPAAAARGHVHKIEGVRTVATFHPRFLLDRPSNKALAWRDLLLLMEEEV